jgi:hypothetical protein
MTSSRRRRRPTRATLAALPDIGTLAAVLAAAAFAVGAAGGCTKSGPAPGAQADRDPSAGAPTKETSGDNVKDEPAPAPASADKDKPVSANPPPPSNPPPPAIQPPPAQDTARYVAWMAQRGKPVKDTPREVVELRLGDWGFFDHGGGPGQALDRAGLDKASHAIQPQEQGHWHAFLTTPGLDAAGALKRVAWLFAAIELGPNPKQPKVTAPTLATAPDGSVKLVGWLAFPPNTGAPMRLTITATPTGAKLVNESAKNL